MMFIIVEEVVFSDSDTMKQTSLGNFFKVSGQPKRELDEKGNPVEIKKSSKREKLITKTVTKQARDLSKHYAVDLQAWEILDREQKLRALQNEIVSTPNLPLMDSVDERNRFVFHRGTVRATLMIIGEAPGYYESQEGRPFVGASGALLDEYLTKNSIDPENHVYITNLVKVRPPNNRDPSYEEVEAYLPFLRRQIAIIKPKLILCMGRIATTVVHSGLKLSEGMKDGEHPRAKGLTAIRCKAISSFYRSDSNLSAIFLKEEKFCCRCYYSYHPSAVLRESEELTVLKDKWEADFHIVAKTLPLPAINYINAIEFLGDSFKSDFGYVNSGHRYAERHVLSAFEQSEAVTANSHKGKFEFSTFGVAYSSYRNEYEMTGRTRDGNSVHFTMKNPKFHMYFGCGEIYRLPEKDIEAIDQWISAETRRIAAEANNIQGPVWAKAEFSQNKSDFYWRPYTKQHLKITFSHNALKYGLRDLVMGAWKNVKSFECQFTPLMRMYLDRKIFTYGWVTTDLNGSLTVAQERKSTCDLELIANYNDVFGECPIPGKSSDPRFEEVAPYKVLSLDAEMLNTEGFPTPEQNPVVSISVYGHTYFDKNDKFEKVKNKKKPNEVRLTGRSNYDIAATFTVGACPQIDSADFNPGKLPDMPPIPKEQIPIYRRGLDEQGFYKGKYVIAIRTWNLFIEKFNKWKKEVGWERVKFYCGYEESPKLYNSLLALKERPDGRRNKKVWDQKTVRKWETLIQTIRKSARIVRDKNLAQCEVNYFSANTDEESFDRIGEIQHNWAKFHKTKDVFCYDSEENLLHGFYSFMQQYNPDQIIGWNINEFDLNYFIRRVQILDIRGQDGKLISMGRMHGREDFVTTKTSTSKARGERTYVEPNIPGRDVFDIMHIFLNETYGKHGSYRLAAIAEKFLGDTKNDVPYSAIPSLFKNNPGRLNDYCLKDAELPMMLCNFLNTMNFVISMCRLIGMMAVGRMNIDGQQGKIFSCLMRFLNEEGLGKIFPDVNPHSAGSAPCGKQEEDGYEGAFVFAPALGLILLILVNIDYRSLYPSIILALNLSHDTAGVAAHMIKMGVDIETQCVKSKKDYLNPKTGEWEPYYFLQMRKFPRKDIESLGLTEADCCELYDDPWLNPETGKEENLWARKLERGSLPGSSTELLMGRKREKAGMKGLHPSSEEYKMKDANQLCFKLICNCEYGVTGVMVGKLAFRAIAETVTITGKEILHDLSQSQLDNFGGKTNGGDTDSIFCQYGQVKKPEDLYERVTLSSVLINPAKYFAETKFTDTVKPRIDHYIDDANSRVPRPVFIEFEKIYEVWLGMARKRAYYIQSEPFFDEIKEEMIFTKGEIQDKGSEIRRRDGCICAQQIIRGFVDILLWVSKKEGRAKAEKDAVAFAKEGVDKIMNGDVPYHHLIQARQLSSSNYASDHLPHVQVNKKLKKRDLPTYPLGSRVPFIIVKARKGTAMYQCAEDPDYALEHGLEPDLLYVIMKKVYGPIERILMHFENKDFMLKKIFGEAMKKNYKVNLLDDDPIARYVTVLKPCEICTRSSMQVVCQSCVREAEWDKLFEKRALELRQLEQRYEEKLMTCRECMSIRPDEEVLCVNSDCEKYYPRKQAEFAISNFQKSTIEMQNLRLLAESI